MTQNVQFLLPLYGRIHRRSKKHSLVASPNKGRSFGEGGENEGGEGAGRTLVLGEGGGSVVRQRILSG